ncbi:MAG TPA: DUF992 domain-containing protein [Stellaceae bacterium]|nr:DUF992 domain-containing protein [Stellaceae bacterium]
MTPKTRATAAAAALAIGALAMAAPTRAEGVKAGVLTCNVARGWGFIFGSSRSLRCIFSPNSGAVEHYVGRIRKFGVDIGYQSGGVIIWGVFAPTVGLGKGALAGDYGGAAGSAAVGVGAGANVLIGGFRKSITLQPVSIEGTTGLNVAAGIAEVTLSER